MKNLLRLAAVMSLLAASPSLIAGYNNGCNPCNPCDPCKPCAPCAPCNPCPKPCAKPCCPPPCAPCAMPCNPCTPCCVPCCPPSGNYYVSAYGGFSWMRNTTITTNGSEDPTNSSLPTFGSGKLDYNVGGGAGGSIGYEWCGGFAAEVDFAWYRNSFKNFRDDDLEINFKDDGGLNIFHYMVNGYWGWNNAFCNITPYVGGGVGGATVWMNKHSSTRFSDQKVVFAYQGIAGIAYSWCKTWSIFAEYRYRGLGNPRYQDHEVTAQAKNVAANILNIGVVWRM